MIARLSVIPVVAASILPAQMGPRASTVHFALVGQPFLAAAALPRGAPGRSPAAGQKARPHKVNSIAADRRATPGLRAEKRAACRARS